MVDQSDDKHYTKVPFCDCVRVEMRSSKMSFLYFFKGSGCLGCIYNSSPGDYQIYKNIHR